MDRFLQPLKNTYMVSSILKEENPEHIREIDRRMTERNYRMFVATAYIVILVSILFVISDVRGHFYEANYPYSILNLTAEIIHLSTAVVLIAAFVSRRDKSDRQKQVYITIFWLLCSIGSSVYSLSDAMRGVVSSGPYFALLILVIAPVFFERKFWIFYGIYVFPTILYYIVSGHWDVMNLTLNFVGYIAHLFLLAAYVREQLLHIKYEESHAELLKMNHTDFLTKIGNRKLLYEQIEHNRKRWIAENKELCLIMIDIDNFKCYNDTYSHLQGDNCLVSVSSAIGKVLEDYALTESVFIRFGGEEFMIMLVGEQLESVLYKLYNGIRKGMEALAIPSGKGAVYPYVTLSAGAEITRYTEELVIEEMMRRADDQLYKAKESGRDRLGYRNRIYQDIV